MSEEEKKSKQPKPKKVSKNDPAKTYANKMRKLQRHIKNIDKRNARRRKKGKPEINNDKKAEEALGKLDRKGTVTPRHKPHAEKWTRQTKDLAHQHRICGYNGNFALKFGQEGVSVYAGMKEYVAKHEEKRKAKFIDTLNKKRQQEEELKKAERQKQVEVERKKFHNNKPKNKKPNTPKKPVAKPAAKQ